MGDRGLIPCGLVQQAGALEIEGLCVVLGDSWNVIRIYKWAYYPTYNSGNPFKAS